MNEHEQNWIKKLDLINFDNDYLAKSSLQKVSFTEKEVSELKVKMQAL